MSDYESVARIFERHAEAFEAAADFPAFCAAIGAQGDGIAGIDWAERQFHTMRVNRKSGVRAPVALPFAQSLTDVFTRVAVDRNGDAGEESLKHLWIKDSGDVRFVEPNPACLDALGPLIGAPKSFQAKRLQSGSYLLTAEGATPGSTWVAILNLDTRGDQALVAA